MTLKLSLEALETSYLILEAVSLKNLKGSVSESEEENNPSASQNEANLAEVWGEGEQSTFVK